MEALNKRIAKFGNFDLNWLTPYPPPPNWDKKIGNIWLAFEAPPSFGNLVHIFNKIGLRTPYRR